MKTLRQELIDFNIKNDAYKFMCPTPEEILIKEVDDYLKSINYELSEPEADGCNKQAKEFCDCGATLVDSFEDTICLRCNKTIRD